MAGSTAAEAKHVAIVGSGIMGLATAHQLLQQYPELRIDLFYDRDTAKTTSYGSGGALAKPLMKCVLVFTTSDELCIGVCNL